MADNDIKESKLELIAKHCLLDLRKI